MKQYAWMLLVVGVAINMGLTNLFAAKFIKNDDKTVTKTETLSPDQLDDLITEKRREVTILESDLQLAMEERESLEIRIAKLKEDIEIKKKALEEVVDVSDVKEVPTTSEVK